MRVVHLAIGLVALLAFGDPVRAGCGCDKPPPPRATVRPFVGFSGQPIAIIDERLAVGGDYEVSFEPLVGGSPRRVGGRVRLRRDLADGQPRPHLRVTVPDVSLGPCRLTVWSLDQRILDVPFADFTVTARPLALGAGNAGSRRLAYRAGVGLDGTIYIPVDLRRVSGATQFWGQGFGLPLGFEAANVAMYNDQGFLMQLLEPTIPGLAEVIPASDPDASAVLAYWRHEFRTFKAAHRHDPGLRLDEDRNWHADGTRHIDHDLIVVAIRGRLTTGEPLAPGATPPFTLAVVSRADDR